MRRRKPGNDVVFMFRVCCVFLSITRSLLLLCFYLFIITVSFDNNIRFQWAAAHRGVIYVHWPGHCAHWSPTPSQSQSQSQSQPSSSSSSISVQVFCLLLFVYICGQLLSTKSLSADQAPIVLRSCFDCRPVRVAAMVGAFFCSVAWEIYNSWHCAAACGMQRPPSPPPARWLLGFAFLHSFLTLFLSIRRLSFVVSYCCSCSNGKLMTFCTSLCDFGGSLTLWSEALSCICADSGST